MSLRHKWATRFGKLEHEAGRIIAIPILLTAILLYFKQNELGFYMSIITLILWAIYLISHTFEKKLYGKKPRGM